ncbi:MAG: DUF6249 domain-containing protein [Bacteroides sp.]
MKQILIALMVAFTVSTLAFGTEEATILRDSVKTTKVSSAKQSAAIQTTNSESTTDSVIGYSDERDTVDADSETTHVDFDSDFPFGTNIEKSINSGIAISIIAIIAVFGFPIFVIFIALYFRHKNRQAKYRLAEQAIAAGQPLPEGLMKDVSNKDARTQGIKNTFTGIGLFIFLWALTGEFGLGCIGLLVMFMGIGQWIVSRNNRPTNEEK